jgi:hypothetical protein
VLEVKDWRLESIVYVRRASMCVQG